MNNALHVIYGTGPMGCAVARELLRRGNTAIRMVNRSGRLPLDLEGVEVVAGDAYDVARNRDLTRGAAVVYQCAQPAYHEWPEKFPPLQAAIVEALTGTTAKLVVCENLYMYGEVNGPLHEDLPYTARTRKGQVRARMAEDLLNAHQAGKIRVAIGRGSDFFGPNDPLSGGFVFYPALAGKQASGYGRLDVPHTMTYTGDFGKALVILGEHDEALGQAWHVPSAPAVTGKEYLQMVFEEAGTAPNIGLITRPMMWLAGFFNAAARETVEMLYEFEKPFVVDHSKFARAFGDHATSLREAIKTTLAWFRAYPDLPH